MAYADFGSYVIVRNCVGAWYIIMSIWEVFHRMEDHEVEEIELAKRDFRFFLFKFFHNAIVHPMMSLPIDEPEWLNNLHDWTGERCKGAG